MEQHLLMITSKQDSWDIYTVSTSTGAPKLVNSYSFVRKRATVHIKSQGVQRSSSG